MTSPIEPAVWFLAVRTGSGTDTFTMQLASALARSGIRTAIHWLPHRAEYLPWSVPNTRPPAWANIVHVNTWLPYQFVSEKLPLVATMHLCVHDKELEPYKTPLQRHYHAWWIRRVEQYVISRAAQIIAVSEYTARITEKAFGCAKPLVIHNAVDTMRTFRAGAPRAPHTPFRLLYAGNWSARKGTDLLAPIMAELGSEFELRYTADRADAHRRNPLPPNCHCISRATSAEKMAALYQDADALLFPSRMEGLPLAVIEAMACGLPVIAARASSLPEAVEDRITGLLCSPNDVQDFIDAARALASSEHQWRAMREAGRARAESEFDMDAMVNAYVEVYRQALT